MTRKYKSYDNGWEVYRVDKAVLYRYKTSNGRSCTFILRYISLSVCLVYLKGFL